MYAEDYSEQREREAAQEAQQDDFLQNITAEEGPLALYKENRLSGHYRRVSIPSTRKLFDQGFCDLPM